MIKATISIVLAIILLAGCASYTAGPQKTAGPETSSGIVQPSPVPDDYTTMNMNTGYYKIPDYNPGGIPEIKTDVRYDSFQGYAASKDGFFVLELVRKEDSASGNEKNIPDLIPYVRKFDQNGKLLWKKEYGMPFSGSGSGKIASYGDGFVFTVEKFPYNTNGQTINQESMVARCDKNGKLIWDKKVADYTGRMFGYLFIDNDGNIATIGNWKTVNGRQVTYDAPEDIVFTKFDADGNVLMQKSYGGTDFENLLSADYSNEFGYVLNYYTRIGSQSVNMLACFDKDFNENFIYKGAEKEYLGLGSPVISDGCVYQNGMIYTDSAGSQQEEYLMKLDSKGNVVWRLGNKIGRIYSVALLTDGNLVMCGTEDDKNYTRVINPDGGLVYEKTGKKDSSSSYAYPLEDGGFVTIARRVIKNIPQPMYISSIWFDTETVAARYDRNFNLIWCKTYDLYHEVTTQEFVYPLEDGRLLVE